MIRFELNGDRELSLLMRKLSQTLNKRAINQTARKAGREVVEEARASTAAVTGNLKRSLGVGTMKTGKDRGGVWVGARGKGSNKGHHAHLYAYGHSGSPGVGSWIQEAADRVRGKVIAILNKEFINSLDNQITKYSKKL